jgi:uncharacterized protein (DUF362 family)
MKRRDFIKKGLVAGLIGGVAGSLGGFEKIYGREDRPEAGDWDLVAVKGGEPEVMFEKAIASLGGMKTYVKSGQTVVVKPNIGWDVPPERAGNTNPKLVAAVVKSCLSAGAKEVYVFDNTCDNWKKCYETSGIEKAAKDAGAKVVSGDDDSSYKEVSIPKGKKLTKAKVHELIINADVFINVPILKSHGSAKLTISMKNLMGVILNRKAWHLGNLHQCIADFATWCKPHLNIVDCYRVMKQNGPRGVSVDDVVLLKSLIISADMVAADAAAAKLLDIDPDDVSYIKLAHEMGVGTKDLTKLKINKIVL